jgi:CRISPR-associated protein Cas6
MYVVDVRFSLSGTVIPVDHGYALFSAISNVIPEFHGADDIGIHHIGGNVAGNRTQLITEQSFLTIRLPADRFGNVMPLAGKVLKLGDNEIRVGVPHSRALIPNASLYSRLVVIKGFMEPESFLAAAQRQLDALGISGVAHLVNQPQIAEANEKSMTGTHSPFLRRTIRIHNKEIVGFALRTDQLTAEESLLLQEKGIGGRRRFGCGIFVPDRKH